MFSLSEIKGIRKKYKFNENGDIELTGKEKAKSPSEMTLEEKSHIESALFLYRQMRNKSEDFNALSDEEFLEQIQTQFTTQALNSNEYAIGIGAKNSNEKTKEISYTVWKSIIKEDVGAMAYFNRVLAENGKKLQTFHRYEIKGMISEIKYDLMDYSKGKFQQSLNPSNPIYTQNPEPKELTPQQKQRRRQFVEKLMQMYRQCEKDENYEDRVKREDSDMSLVINTVDRNGSFEILSSTASVRVMDLLYAAQNVSLDGEKDYLEAFIEKPEISEFLLNMRNNNILDRMQKKAQERKDNGTISIHRPTHGEVAIRNANAIIKEHPNAVETVKGELSGKQPTFIIEKGNVKNLKRANLIEIVARIQARYISRSTDESGNKILTIDGGKDVIK